MFEKKDSRVKSAAATNLSFLYYLVSSAFHKHILEPCVFVLVPRRGSGGAGGA